MALSTLSFEESYEAIRSGVVGRVVRLDAIAVTGKDTWSYLEGQCSQDLAALHRGEVAETLLLSPQGKIDAYARVLRLGEEEALLLVAEGFGEQSLERLRHFRLRVKVDFSLEVLPVAELRGPNAGEGSLDEALGETPVRWPGLVGRDLFGAAGLPPGVPVGDDAAFEVARIEAGMPLLGRELDTQTIPYEADLVERTVSFSKGCYTGQELIARLDARGANVPRRLRGVVAQTGEELPREGRVVFRGDEVGGLTSVAFSPRTGSGVGLAYVRRRVEPPQEAEVVGDDKTMLVTIATLPLVGGPSPS